MRKMESLQDRVSVYDRDDDDDDYGDLQSRATLTLAISRKRDSVYRRKDGKGQERFLLQASLASRSSRDTTTFISAASAECSFRVAFETVAQHGERDYSRDNKDGNGGRG